MFRCLVSGTMLGPESCMVTCPTCNAVVSTTVRKQITTKTHIFFFIMCITYVFFHNFLIYAVFLLIQFIKVSSFTGGTPTLYESLIKLIQTGRI